MRNYSNSDPPIRLENLKINPNNQLIQVLIETAGVWKWYIKIDKNPDPPVLVEEVKGGMWKIYANRFSDFIFCRILEYLKYKYFYVGTCIIEPITKKELLCVKKEFKKIVKTSFATSRNVYCFVN